MGQGKENVAGNIVEIKLEDIYEITLFESETIDSKFVAQVEKDAKKIGKRLPLAPIEAALRAIGLVIFHKVAIAHIMNLPQHIAANYDK